MDYKKLLFEAQTSTLNKSALQTHLLKLSTLNETYSDFSIQKLLDLNSELKIVDVNYNNIYLQHIQIPITLISPQSKFKVKIRGYFDSGSSICLISPNLVRKLELKASGVINIRTVNATSTSKIVDLEYKLEAQPRNSKKKLSIHHTTQAAVLENMSDSFAGLEFVLSVDIFNYVKNKYNINITDLSKK